MRSDESTHRRMVQAVGKAEMLEKAIARQFALNEAAAEKILRLQQDVDDLASYITALVTRLGGRVEIPMDEIRAIPVGTRVHWKEPTPEKDVFTFLLSHTPPEGVEAQLEEQLRAAGMSDEEIGQLKQRVADAEVEATKLFEQDPAAAEAKLLGADGKPVEPAPAAGAICGCGHTHNAGSDGEDGGCSEATCTCTKWVAPW